MTGPEHYKVAQSFLADATNFDYDSPLLPSRLATAQVHATLALAAATAAAHVGIKDAPAGWAHNNEWARAIS